MRLDYDLEVHCERRQDSNLRGSATITGPLVSGPTDISLQPDSATPLATATRVTATRLAAQARRCRQPKQPVPPTRGSPQLRMARTGSIQRTAPRPHHPAKEIGRAS